MSSVVAASPRCPLDLLRFFCRGSMGVADRELSFVDVDVDVDDAER